MENNLLGSLLLPRAKVEENSLQSFLKQNLVCDKAYCPLIKKVLNGFTFPYKGGLQFDHNSCTLARTSDFPMCALLFSAPALPINSHSLVIAVARFSLCPRTCQAIRIHLHNGLRKVQAAWSQLARIPFINSYRSHSPANGTIIIKIIWQSPASSGWYLERNKVGAAEVLIGCVLLTRP